MSKLKTHRGAAKRFKKTGTGHYKHRCSNRSHILTKKAQGRKLGLRSTALVHVNDTPAVARMLNDR